MKENVSFYTFEDRFLSSDTYKGSFTHEGLRALFEYLEQYEEETGEEIEFDMVALCCEYSEFESAKEAAEDHGATAEDMEPETDDEDEREKAARGWPEDNTTVIYVEGGGVIIQQF